MQRGRFVMAALSLVLATAGGVLNRRRVVRAPKRTQGNTAPAPEVAAPPPPVVAEAAPKPVARLDRGLAVLGTLGLLVTAGLMVWELFGSGPPTALEQRVNLPFVGAFLTLLIWAIYLFWKVPQWQAVQRGEREVARFELENSARGTLGQLLSGLAVVAGLLFAWQQLGNTAETLRVSQEGQITERFTRAVEQLGGDELTVRLGGVYALERIARDSERDHRPVMEVLSAFVRQEAPRGSSGGMAATPVATALGMPPEVQAALTVIGRREASWDGTGGCLDLRGARLAGADLSEVPLSNICLAEADLSFANLQGVDLSGQPLNRVNFSGADLSGADLSGATLAEANFAGSSLERANLAGANLLRANLSSALLDDADLREANLFAARMELTILFGANLAGARNLTADQLAVALVDGRTTLPNTPAATPD